MGEHKKKTKPEIAQVIAKNYHKRHYLHACSADTLKNLNCEMSHKLIQQDHMQGMQTFQ